MKMISIDRTKHLAEDPGTGHNRWHPDITPILEAEPGEEVVLETRDASDGHVTPGMPATGGGGGSGVHPLAGPVYVNGAQPGDLLEIEYLEITPQPYGYTRFNPGRGYLHDLFTTPFPKGLCKTGAKFHPKQGYGEYTLITGASTSTENERRQYRWSRGNKPGMEWPSEPETSYVRKPGP